jgi:hypothetical protein
VVGVTDLWWSCRSCGHESYDSVTAFHHTQDTGHDGHALATTGIGPGPGSSPAARAAARQACADAVTAAKQKGRR